MEFAGAVRQCVDTMGADVVRDSRRFVSCLLDYADDSLALRAAARNLDDGALAPFVEALDAGDADSLGLASAKVEMTLRNDRGLESSVAHDIASAIGEGLSGVLAPPPKQEADAQGISTPQPESVGKTAPSPVDPVSPVSPQQSQAAASQPPSQAHAQSSAPAPKGRTFLGHGFWWWYGVSWGLFALGYVSAPLFGSVLVAPCMCLWLALTSWAMFVKFPVFLYRTYGPKKKAQP